MGTKKNIIKKNNYKDSVFLMQIASELEKLDDISSASLMMGTPANKEIMRDSNLLLEDGENSSDNDLIIAIDAENEQELEKALNLIEERFNQDTDTDDEEEKTRPTTIETALKSFKDANLVLISVAGTYAAREARIALENGLHVMIFSDNVSLEQEIELKELAVEKELLLMGPDCGTAIINGVPLGFANRIPEGDIGIVGASGTGLQELTVTIAKSGAGITQAFGTGGRDLTLDVGGKTMALALEYLKNDPKSKVLALVSKPPHPDIAQKIIDSAKKTDKKVVICFLGSSSYKSEDNIYFSDTLEAAGIMAAKLSRDEPLDNLEFSVENKDELLNKALSKITGNEQKFLRGLYSGGTLCDESLDILSKSSINAYSNAGKNDNMRLDDLNVSKDHTLIDMGEDEFTRGRPHPMIDLSLRNKRILSESKDPSVAVLLFDVVLGYGANPDPVGGMIETIKKVDNSKIMVSSVCGTDIDPQNYSTQVKKLQDAGVFVMPTNAQAARFTVNIIEELNK